LVKHKALFCRPAEGFFFPPDFVKWSYEVKKGTSPNLLVTKIQDMPKVGQVSIVVITPAVCTQGPVLNVY